MPAFVTHPSPLPPSCIHCVHSVSPTGFPRLGYPMHTNIGVGIRWTIPVSSNGPQTPLACLRRVAMAPVDQISTFGAPDRFRAARGCQLSAGRVVARGNRFRQRAAASALRITVTAAMSAAANVPAR